jgi:hypothetical protein
VTTDGFEWRIERVVQQWRTRGIGVLIVGGQVMLADGLREQTKDLDACIAARQCPRMLEWLAEQERLGVSVEIRAGSAPLHPDWLGRGWTFHVELAGADRLDFFGIPLRAPNRLVERFFADPSDTALASLTELGYLKRTERPQDWADIDLIVGRLRERHDLDASTEHLFGNALVEELMASRHEREFREALERSQQGEARPILRLGLTAPLDELRGMARAEQRFWEVAGALRSDELRDTLRRFWREHAVAIRTQDSVTTRHAALLAAARVGLPISPIRDPAALIERARSEAGTNRWPELLPATPILVSQYFPEYRNHLGARLHDGSRP